MDAHKLAEQLLKMPKGTEVFVHGSYDNCWEVNPKFGKHGNKPIVILYPSTSDHISDGHFVERKK